MKIKVCGMLQAENIKQLVELNPDYIGFIFYKHSKRYIGVQIPDDINGLIPATIQKVGVFVDEPYDAILEKYHLNKLDLLQLHGSESPDYCDNLRKLRIPIIKAFKISGEFDFESIKSFESLCEYFLFDTAGQTIGGTGIKFNWDILNKYRGSKPFFLSGGISSSDCDSIRNLKHSELFAVDVNSGFETGPGIKDILKVSTFINELRQKLH